MHRLTPSDIRIVLVHGVGLAPSLFDDLMAELSPLRCLAVVRLGYRPATTSTADLGRLVADIDDLCSEPTLLVGLSGGATIALALSIHQSTSRRSHLMRVIAHEPLVGPLVPDLHRAVTSRAGELMTTPGALGAERFVEGLVGQTTWAALPEAAREFTRRHHDTVRVEVSAFTSFTPTITELRSLGPGLTVTVGSASAQPRHDVAGLLVRHGRADARTIAGAGHLAPWERPVAYAAVVRDVVAGMVAA